MFQQRGGEHSPLFDIGNKHCDPKLVFSTFVLTVSDSAKKVWKAGSVKQNQYLFINTFL